MATTSKFAPPVQEIGYPWFIHVADPAVGISFVNLTLPDVRAEWSYYIHSATFKVKTDATVGNRVIGCRLFHHTGSPGNLWELGHTDVQPENLTRTYVFASGVPIINMDGNAIKTASIPKLAMNGNLRFAVKFNFGQATDELTDIWFHIALFLPGGYAVDWPIP